MIADVVRMAIELHELASSCGEGKTVLRLECHDGDSRAELVILREDILCGHMKCDLQHALEMLANAHEMFRLRGHGLRVEIVARRPWESCRRRMSAPD